MHHGVEVLRQITLNLLQTLDEVVGRWGIIMEKKAKKDAREV